MTPFRIMIVDDEAHARARVKELVEPYPEVTLVAAAASPEEALRLATELRPDALFLDIELGCLDGFALLQSLPEPRAEIVFVTAHEAFGTRAFSVDAVDYLLKPLGPARFAQAMRKLLRTLRQRQEEQLIPVDGGAIRLPLHAITHIEADGNYTIVYQRGDRSLHVRRGIQQWEEQLPADRFIRVHRSLIVNRSLVRMLRSRSREEGEIRLEGITAPLPLRRRALQRLRRFFTGASAQSATPSSHAPLAFEDDSDCENQA